MASGAVKLTDVKDVTQLERIGQHSQCVRVVRVGSVCTAPPPPAKPHPHTPPAASEDWASRTTSHPAPPRKAWWASWAPGAPRA